MLCCPIDLSTDDVTVCLLRCIMGATGVILDNMADTIVYLTEGAVKGATLPCHVVEDNSSDDLQRWLKCRGFSSSASESKTSLYRRLVALKILVRRPMPVCFVNVSPHN